MALNRTVSRIAGSLLPNTPVTWTIDGAYLDATSYTWSLECRSVDGGAVLFTKSSGLTGQVGSSTVPSIVIVWLAGDLGALTAGSYLCELSGLAGGKNLKGQFNLVVTSEVA